MRISIARLAPSQVVIERSLAAVILIALLYVGQQYAVLGHLPRPFHSDPSQSLMDLYNTAYWANRPGAYQIWHTVYPPLPLLFTQIITNHTCYSNNAYMGRICDPNAAWFIVIFYIINIALVYGALRKSKIKAAAPRTFALCMGLPMLYGLELANLIIPCFTFFVLAEGGLLRASWARQLCRGLAFNFKLYLLASIAPYILRFRIRWLIGLSISFIFVYLITFYLYKSGSPHDLLSDLFIYTRSQSNIYIQQNHLIEISIRSNGIWNYIVPASLRLGEFIAIAGIILGALSKKLVSRHILSAVSFSLVCSEAAIHTQGFSADYTQIFLIFFIFIENNTSSASFFTAIMAYMLCISADFSLMHVVSTQSGSYFSGKIVGINFDLTLSQFVRPMLIVLIQAGLTGVILQDAVLPTTLMVSARRPSKR